MDKDEMQQTDQDEFLGRTRKQKEGALDEGSTYSGGDEEPGAGSKGIFMSLMEVNEI